MKNLCPTTAWGNRTILTHLFTTRKSIGKQTKAIEKHGEKQIEALKSFDKESPSIKNFILERTKHSQQKNAL